MGIFSKSPKPNPKIVFEGIEFLFHRNHEMWEFTYREMAFYSHTPSLCLPTKAELDSIVNVAESLFPEMRKRLAKGLAEWRDGDWCETLISKRGVEMANPSPEGGSKRFDLQGL